MNKKLTISEEKELKHHTRRLSIKEGIFWSARASFGDNYISPFSIFLGITNSMVAVINSLWNLGPSTQLIGSKLVNKFKRKSILTKTLTLEAFGWLLMTITAIFYYKSILTNLLQYFIIASISIIVLAGGLGHPAWFSWIGDVVDKKFRGRWFSKRNTIISFTTIMLTLTAAIILTYFQKINKEEIGFIVLFSIAFLARASCIKIIKNHYEPKLKKRKKEKTSIKNFIKEIKSTNLGKFILFRSMFAFSITLTSPLVAIYLLRYLQFDYLTYIIITLSGTFFSVITLNLWGRIADKQGNYKVIALTTLIIPITPLLWILSPSKIYLFIVPAILGGTSWTAFIMSSGNFVYDNTKAGERSNAVSYLNLFLGIGAFLGGLTAALLIKNVKTSWIEPIFLIFIIGALTRMIIVGFWIPKLKEITKKRKKGKIRNIILKEAKPAIIEDLHEITSIRGYIKEK